MSAGLTIFGKKHQDSLLVDPLFVKAKKGDERAALSLLQSLWTEEKSDELKHLLGDNTQDVVFISMPSTSRQNKIPPVFVQFLAEKTNGNYLIGDEHFMLLHAQMMNSIKNGQRLMHPRLFEPFDADFFSKLKDHTAGCRFVVVEDILTTGASVNTFRRYLEKNGIPVHSLIGVKGDADITPSVAMVKKLQKMGQKIGLDFDLTRLGEELTNKEVSTLIFQVMGSSYVTANDADKEKIKKQIFYLYDIKVNGNFKSIEALEKITEELEKSLREGEKNNEKNSSKLKKTLLLSVVETDGKAKGSATAGSDSVGTESQVVAGKTSQNESAITRHGTSKDSRSPFKDKNSVRRNFIAARKRLSRKLKSVLEAGYGK